MDWGGGDDTDGANDFGRVIKGENSYASKILTWLDFLRCVKTNFCGFLVFLGY